jgi:trimeric autotransporter adhesin
MTHPTLFTTLTLALQNSISWSSLRRHFFVGTLAVTSACFGLPQTTPAVTPAPDGGYPNGNTAEGDNALGSLTTGSFNTAIGLDALQAVTTGSNNTANGAFALANNSADDNTATGSQALITNTTGNNNTANGVAALQNNSTGNDNTANGSLALLRNTTGFSNTANGASALHDNTEGHDNTATGFEALLRNTLGSFNTANGSQALQNNTTGIENTANGLQVLFHNTTGNNNTANGFEALFSNTTGSNNTVDGLLALENNTIGHDNSAEGFEALANNTTGSSNIALGSNAGINLTTGSNNIDIGAPGAAGESKKIRIGKQGTQSATFIAGIRGATVASGVAVVVSSNGQLGTVTSSARFKDKIKPMDKASEAILALKPVTFRYKEEIDPDGIPQFGLVAEEVEKVNPDLITRDEEGKPTTVRYEAVNAMLLNEFLKEHRKVERLEGIVTRQQKQIEALTATVQKVSDQVALSKPPQLVANH